MDPSRDLTWLWIARLEGPRGKERWAPGAHRVLVPQGLPALELGAALSPADLLVLTPTMRAGCGHTLRSWYEELAAAQPVPFLERAKRAPRAPGAGRREIRVVAVSHARGPLFAGARWKESPFVPCGDCARGVLGKALLRALVTDGP